MLELRRAPLGVALGLVGVLLCVGLAVLMQSDPDDSTAAPAVSSPGEGDLDKADVERVCTGCHLFSDPDTLPRSAWWKTIHDMVRMPGYVGGDVSTEALVAWYEARAPEELELPQGELGLESDPLEWERRAPDNTGGEGPPFVANVQFLDLLGDGRRELVVCDMSYGLVQLGRPYAAPLHLETIGLIPNPAHSAAVDLDDDGLQDLVVANLGSLPPMDHHLGSVEWLRQTGEGQFETVVLAEGVGRVADVRPADFDADGDWDLALAEFGWRETGQVWALEARAECDTAPCFTYHHVDTRHGAIHAEIAQLDGDGLPDFVTVLAQEHEMVVAYLNRGEFTFEAVELYQAPHPAWGTSGIQLVDLDGDADLDILTTNGDVFDDPWLKPYHGIRWLEQTGPLQFAPHHLALLYGAHRAEAADLDGDGDLDIAACSFIPEATHAEVREKGLTIRSLVWFEQTSPGVFAPHALERNRPYHPTLAVGDCDADGDIDLAVGSAFFAGESEPEPEDIRAVEVWINVSRAPGVEP